MGSVLARDRVGRGALRPSLQIPLGRQRETDQGRSWNGFTIVLFVPCEPRLAADYYLRRALDAEETLLLQWVRHYSSRGSGINQFGARAHDAHGLVPVHVAVLQYPFFAS